MINYNTQEEIIREVKKNYLEKKELKKLKKLNNELEINI